ncbi:MAG: hypothetical protein HY329_15985 [Chloroflexi bacterium]|nr:hypothetical protein [Chloroflexota bacterium]
MGLRERVNRLLDAAPSAPIDVTDRIRATAVAHGIDPDTAVAEAQRIVIAFALIGDRDVRLLESARQKQAEGLQLTRAELVAESRLEALLDDLERRAR